MERLGKEERHETRLTQAELAALLSRWRDEQEDTVSVGDVAEALHCSKAEIEALVWRSRAESGTGAKVKVRTANVRTMMMGTLVIAIVLFSFAIAADFPPKSGIFMLASLFFTAWVLYSTVSVIADAINGRE